MKIRMRHLNFFVLLTIFSVGCNVANSPEEVYEAYIAGGDIRVDRMMTIAQVQEFIHNNPRIRKLRLPYRSLDDRAFEELNTLTSLEAIDLSYTNISKTTVEKLSELPSLVLFAAIGTRLGDSSVKYLSALSELRILYLGGTEITNDGIAMLRNLRKLKYLSIGDTPATGSCLKTLPKSLIYLNLFGMKCSGADLKTLDRLKDCETLVLRYCIITDKNKPLLRDMPSLKDLNLVGVKLGAEDIMSLVKSLPSLELLTISGLPSEDLKSVQKAYPKLKLEVEE